MADVADGFDGQIEIVRRTQRWLGLFEQLAVVS